MPVAAGVPPVDAAPPPPRHAFEPELGPEPTQIGAMPLISFGGSPLVALVGEDPRRASSATLPPPVGTFVPETTEEPRKRPSKRVLLIAGAAVVVVLVVILLATC